MSEADHQAALFRWARTQEATVPELRLLHAIPNGAYFGKSGGITGWRMKQEGLKPGVPDLCLPVARWGFHGLYIEMKNDRPPGILSPEQRNWLDDLKAEGYSAHCCFGWDDARAVLQGYLA